MKHKSLRLIVYVAACVTSAPLLLLLFSAFSNRWAWPDLIPRELSLRGFERMLSGNLVSLSLLGSSLALSLGVAVSAVIIATLAARAMHLYDFRGKAILELITVLPIIVPATVFGMGSHMFFIEMGLNNSILAVMIAHLIVVLPFAVRIMLGVTKTADMRLEEQALNLGASRARAFFEGTLPVISPGMLSALSVSFLFSYTQFFLTMLMGGGKVKTTATLAMPLILGADRSISSMYSIFFIATTLIVFLLFQGISRLLAKKVGAQLGS